MPPPILKPHFNSVSGTPAGPSLCKMIGIERQEMAVPGSWAKAKLAIINYFTSNVSFKL